MQDKAEDKVTQSPGGPLNDFSMVVCSGDHFSVEEEGEAPLPEEKRELQPPVRGKEKSGQAGSNMGQQQMKPSAPKVKEGTAKKKGKIEYAWIRDNSKGDRYVEKRPERR